MELSNYIGRYARLPEASQNQEALKEAKLALVTLLNPFAPHTAHELWEHLGQEGMVEEANWPEFDPELIKESVVTVVVQINGKVRDRITVPAGSSDEEVTEKALSAERVMKMIGEGEKARSRVKNVIVVKDKLVNIVV